MEMTEQQKQQLEKIRKKFDLKLILLYGSFAKGTPREESDLDIACLPHKPINFHAELELYADLAAVFGDMKRELDVVILQKKDPFFLYQVAKHSRLLYGNLPDYHEFLAYAFRSYHDSKDLRELERKLVKRYQSFLNATYAR